MVGLLWGFVVPHTVRANQPAIQLYPHAIAQIPTGTNSYWTNWPSSTTAGFAEIQQLFPWSTNGYSSGFKLELSAGDFTFTSPIYITNNCHICGMGWPSTVLRYTGSTNAFTVNAVTNRGRTVQYAGCVFIVATNFGTATSQYGNPAPNVEIDDLSLVAATNMPAILLYSFAVNLQVHGVLTGGPEIFRADGGGVHIGWVEPRDLNGPSGLIGFYCMGSSENHIAGSFCAGIADGIVFDSDAYCYADDCQFPTLGQWAERYSTLYPTNHFLSLGAGVLVKRAFHVGLTRLLTYRDRIGVALLTGRINPTIDLENFIDQYSEYPIAVQTNGTGSGGIRYESGYVPLSSIYCITNDSSGNYYVSDFPALFKGTSAIPRFFGHNYGGNEGWNGYAGEVWSMERNKIFGYNYDRYTLSGTFYVNQGFQVSAGQINATNFVGLGAGLTNNAGQPFLDPNATNNIQGGQITGGTIAVARLGTGTPDATKYLRGDGTWQNTNTIASARGAVGPTAVTTNTLQTTIALTGISNVLLNLSFTNVGTPSFYVLATTNIYFIQPTNTVTGQSFAVWVVQDTSGRRTVNFDTNYFKFSGGVVPIATTNGGAYDLYEMRTFPLNATNVAVALKSDFK
jgi:hypothetical protein